MKTEQESVQVNLLSTDEPKTRMSILRFQINFINQT